MLEVASGTGQHAEYFCAKRPDLSWQASDADPSSILSIESYRTALAKPNFLPPVRWSVLEPVPPALKGPFDALVNINMIHIAPWEACLALFDHAQSLLAKGGVLYLYGPYFRPDRQTAPSNLEFHRSLQTRDPAWGLRDMEVVKAEALKRGFCWQDTVDMPANNFSLVFLR